MTDAINKVADVKNPPLWETAAIEALSSLERLVVLSAVNKGKQLVSEVTRTLTEEGKQVVTKSDVQRVTSLLVDDFLQERSRKPS